MPTPASRTPVRIARGTYANLLASIADLNEGEVCFATDENTLYVKSGGTLVASGKRLKGDLRFGDSDNSNWVALQAPATVSTNVTWTLPSADGTNGQVLGTNGSGTLSWITASGGASVTTSDTAPVSPSDGDLWYRSTDGRLYVYYDDGTTSQWVDAAPQGGGAVGASVTTSDTPPATPNDGDLWYDSVGGRTYVYYQDPNGSQWVDASPQGGGGSGTSITTGNTTAEVIDTGSDGRFVVTTEGTERLRVDSSGRVGVGAATPRAKLDLGGDLATQKLALYADSTYRIGFGVQTNEFRQYTHQGGFINWGYVSTSDQSTFTEQMRLASNGNLYWGTTSTTFGTADGIYFSEGGRIFATRSADAAFVGSRLTNDGAVAMWFRGTSYVGNISVNGSSTSYNTSSDYRLKENVTLLTGATDRLKQLPVHRFNFITDPDKTVDGFLAHEAQAVVPECVTGTKDEVDANGDPIYQGIDQSKLVPLLTAALQEAVARIEAQDTTIASLEARLTALEGGN